MSTTIGPFAFASNHLIFILSCLLALSLAWLLSRRQSYNLGDAVFRIIAVGLIAARLLFVIVYYEAYLTAPWQILNVRDGGFNVWAGLIAGSLWALYELRRLPQGRLRLVGATGSPLVLAIIANLLLQAQVSRTEFPNAALTTLQQDPIQLEQAFSGQPTVVNLWATWCPPCVREMPILEAAVEKWPDVAFVTINQGESHQQVTQFLQQQGLALPHVLLDPQGQVGDIVGSHALPTTLFFRADGTLSYHHIGEFSAATLENAVRRIE